MVVGYSQNPPRVDEMDNMDPEFDKDGNLDCAGTVSGLSDQGIRARALECAVRYGADVHDSMNFWDLVHKFEAYIRDGVT